MTLTIRKEHNATMSPTIANVSLDRAAATFDLSPPEFIHAIPPRIR